MRCSTVSGLFEVAAAAAGGLLESILVPAVWADADPLKPAASATLATEVTASVRRSESFMNDSFPMPHMPARGWRGSYDENGVDRTVVAVRGAHEKRRALGP